MDKEISEAKYEEMIGAVPPHYITTINGDHFKGAFALGEANSHINTPNGVKEAYSAFYKVGDKYYEVDGLVYFTQPLTAVRAGVVARKIKEHDVVELKETGEKGSVVHIYPGGAMEVETKDDVVTVLPDQIKSSYQRETEISRYTIPTSNKQIVLRSLPVYSEEKKVFLQTGYEVVVSNTLTGDRIVEYPGTTSKNTAAKNYIEAIGKYSKHKIISEGVFSKWLVKNELNIQSLKEYATEQNVSMYDEGFAKGGKAKEKKVSSYPKKGHILDKFAGIEPLLEDKETKVFVNTDIFTSPGDYILGGFDLSDLDNIEVVGDGTILTPLKVKMLFRERILKAISKFYYEIENNLAKRVGEYKVNDLIDGEFSNEISNLLETYLNIKPEPLSTNEQIADLIINSESAFSWLNTIGERIDKFSSAVMFDGVSINKIDQSKVAVADAEENTHNSTLEQILEQLHSITEKS